MAGLFGGKSNASTTPKYTQLNLQTSTQGMCIPIIYGKVRTGANIIWAERFTSHAQKQSAGKGGGGGSVTSYTYSMAVMLALCEGPIQSVGTVWASKATTTLAALGLSLFTGTLSQAPWGYLTSMYPSQADAYSGTAYLATSSYDLGSSPDLPQHNFEVVGTYSGTMPYVSMVDVNPADMLVDYLTNPYYGLQFPSDSIDTTSKDLWKTYCQAQSIFFSVAITQQEQAATALQRWATLTNTWIFWSGTALKFVPLGNVPLSFNGVTYSPNVTPVYDITYDDMLRSASGDQPPLTVTRSDPLDGYNQVQLDIKDRNNSYNVASILWEDSSTVDQYGRLQAQIVQADEICDNFIGTVVASLIGKRSVYIRNTYQFALGFNFILLEVGDIVTLTDPNIGLDHVAVLIRQIEEDDLGILKITAEEYPEANGQAATYASPTWEGSVPVNVQVDPGNVNTPGIIEPDAAATGGQPQVWLALSGGVNWGGAAVFISFDGGTTYSQIGTVSAPSLQGTLTAPLPSHVDPDTVDTLSVDLAITQGVMSSTATTADADALRTLMMVDQEIMAYGNAASGAGPYVFDLTYLRRGQYGTAPASHSTGALYSRLDPNTVFVYNLPPQYVGQTLYFKFLSYNNFGQTNQDLSSATPYPYTPSGAAYFIAPPTSVSLTSSRVVQTDGTIILSMNLSWLASVGPLLGNYEIQFSTDGGTTWATDTTVGAGATSYSLQPALVSTNYIGRVRAISTTGLSLSTWATSSTVNSGPLSTAVPATPVGVTVTAGAGSATVGWTIPADPTILYWRIYRALGPGGSFGSSTLMQQLSANSWTDISVSSGTVYTYWVVAVNTFGPSLPGPTAGVDVDPLPLGSGQPYDIPMSWIGNVTSSMIFYRATFTRAVTLSAGLPLSQANASTAPSTTPYYINILKNGVVVGSVNWAVGAVTATFTFAATTAWGPGDVLEMVGSATVDAVFSDPSITLAGIR